MSDIIETETLTATSGTTYTLEYLIDHHPSNPYADDYMQSDLVLLSSRRYDGRAEAGKHGASVLGDRVFDRVRRNMRDHSERAIARYLLLAGMHGVTLVNRSKYDGALRRQKVTPDMLDELGTSLDDRSAQCDGFAWLTPEALTNLSDGADYHEVVADEVDIYEAYLSGDVFGYVLKDSDDTAVKYADGWGYFGLERERAHVKNEAIDAMNRHDAETVAARKAAHEYAVEAARVKAAELVEAARVQAIEAKRLDELQRSAAEYWKTRRRLAAFEPANEAPGAAAVLTTEMLDAADRMAALILGGE